MTDLVRQLNILERWRFAPGDAADALVAWIATSWLRGDRSLCGDCWDMRNPHEPNQGGTAGTGRCHGCGDMEQHLWSWSVEDLIPAAAELVELRTWTSEIVRES